MHLKNFKNKSMQQPNANNLITSEAIACRRMRKVLVKFNKKVLDCKHTVIMGINLLSDDEGNVKKIDRIVLPIGWMMRQ